MTEKFEFTWDAVQEKGLVPIRSYGAIAVYLNEVGDVVLRQQNELGDSEDDEMIIVQREMLSHLIAAMLKA
jgi:hypothetical protein